MSNVVFTFVFLLEMILKVSGMGVYGYCYDWFNVFDGLIVIASLIELSFSQEASVVSVLRAFRPLRIFKLFRRWKKLQDLLKTIANSFREAVNLGLLIMLFIFIMAMVGK